MKDKRYISSYHRQKNPETDSLLKTLQGIKRKENSPDFPPPTNSSGKVTVVYKKKPPFEGGDGKE